MKKFELKVIAIITLLSGIGVGTVHATADSTVPTGTRSSGAVFLATPVSDNHYLLQENRTRESTSLSSTATPENAPSAHFENADISQTPDNSNNAGEPNMGSTDHVQGTTGTSGQ